MGYKCKAIESGPHFWPHYGRFWALMKFERVPTGPLASLKGSEVLAPVLQLV